jgi:hypothetical protein
VIRSAAFVSKRFRLSAKSKQRTYSPIRLPMNLLALKAVKRPLVPAVQIEVGA